MSNVIGFLEQMGKNAALSRLEGEEFAAAVDALGLDDAPRQALLARDHEALNALLGGRLAMTCMLFPADDDNKKDDDQDDSDQPDQDDRKESIHRAGLH
jgi:hypothetical protein